MKCSNCGNPITPDLEYCMSCRAAVHSCNNCVYREEVVCRKVRGLLGPAGGARPNDCEEWTPGRETRFRSRTPLSHAKRLPSPPIFRT